jgi:FkbM family methyltransferase
VRRYPEPTPIDTHLANLVHGLEIDCVLDVGGHVGDFGALLRASGYTGRIISFEPVAANAARLRERLDPEWLLVEKAVGSTAGRRAMNLTAGSEQHSLHAPSQYGHDLRPKLFMDAGVELVDVIRIDDIFSEFVLAGERVFLTIDTQGHDLEVLRGAERSLGAVDALLLELGLRHVYEGQPDYLETLRWLRDRGFEPTGIFPFFNDPGGWVVEAKCFCRRVTNPPAPALASVENVDEVVSRAESETPQPSPERPASPS